MAQNWGFYTLLTELPTYMKNILHFDIKVGVIVHVLEKMVIDYLLNVRYYDTREHPPENASDSVIKFNTMSLLGERVYICPTILTDVAVCLVH